MSPSSFMYILHTRILLSSHQSQTHNFFSCRQLTTPVLSPSPSFFTCGFHPTTVHLLSQLTESILSHTPPTRFFFIFKWLYEYTSPPFLLAYKIANLFSHPTTLVLTTSIDPFHTCPHIHPPCITWPPPHQSFVIAGANQSVIRALPALLFLPWVSSNSYIFSSLALWLNIWRPNYIQAIIKLNYTEVCVFNNESNSASSSYAKGGLTWLKLVCLTPQALVWHKTPLLFLRLSNSPITLKVLLLGASFRRTAKCIYTKPTHVVYLLN